VRCIADTRAWTFIPPALATDPSMYSVAGACSFLARDTGDEPHLSMMQRNCQAPSRLELKIGAQASAHRGSIRKWRHLEASALHDVLMST